MAEKRPESIKTWTQYSAGALEMGISVVIGLGIGYWLDKQLGTAPWMALFWMTCGSIAGFRSLYRLAKKLEAQDAEMDKGDGDDEPR